MQGPVKYAVGHTFFVIYPLIPWIGVMAGGYLFGSIFQKEERERRGMLCRPGFGVLGGFILLRAINLYGDPHPWAVQGNVVNTILSFIDTHKYPPSLWYIMMTLGPAIAVLPLLERWKGRLAGFLTVFGRVPLFFHVLHIPLIHLLAVGGAMVQGLNPSFLFSNAFPGMWTASYGLSLPVVYLVWIGVILALYLPCRWFAGVKRRRKDVWLSYL